MKKIGNLFELAEKQLKREKSEGVIPCYTELDVIEYAIMIRKWLDKNPNKAQKVMKLTKEELKKHNKDNQRRFRLKGN